ncbi:hypothetical protein ACQP1P_23250 [Dactylosporangium sp. CA-052675]|uniref:DUF7933 domain-containing protein n=1 Tax=Dactylosporangium sp. CA-052675 TaxID=3239927 RepID=UPI003D8DEF9F
MPPVIGQPYVAAFFANPATVPIGEPTALGIAVFNPTRAAVPFTFTAALPPHLKITPLGAPPQNTCGGPVTTTQDGTKVTTWGRVEPMPGGCGVILPVIADQTGTYTAADVTLSDVAGVPTRVTDIRSTCGDQCGALAPILTVTTMLAPQTIAFGPLADATLSTTTVRLTGSASSGLPLKYTSETRPVCTVSEATVTLLTLGTCTITADQPGDATYAAAEPVTASFTVR